jgi:hypothetical protein
VRFSLSLIVLTLMTPSVAAAQGAASPVEIYLVGGLNVAKVTTPIPEVTIPELRLETGSRVGFAGGVLVDVPLMDAIGIETGALLSIRGVTTTAEVFGVRTDLDLRMTYLDIPALVRVGLAKSDAFTGFLLAGPTLGFHMSSSARLTTEGIGGSEGVSDLVNPVDLGLTFGGRVQYKRVIGDVRYTFGLLATADAGGDLLDDTSKHRVLSFMAGWRF